MRFGPFRAEWRIFSAEVYISSMRLTLYDLQEFCRTNAEESVHLEFKVCNELRLGVHRRGAISSHDDVVQELSKDVSAFLNAGGGTIVYGIREKNSRAYELDEQNAFSSSKDPKPEKLLQWVRAHISPPPTIDIYSVRLQENDHSSPWLLVVDIPQGQEAYMARDKRFYKRVSNTAQPMEQYEVVDVMRRSNSAVLDVKLGVGPIHRNWFADEGRTRASIGVSVSVTTANYISAEHGALRFLLAPPLLIDQIILLGSFRNAQLEERVPIQVGTEVVIGQSLKIRWGADAGNIVYPGDWYNFWGNPVRFEVPDSIPPEHTTYAFMVDMYTVNAPVRSRYFLIDRSPKDETSIRQVQEEEFARTAMSRLIQLDG
jgi:Putative DNA-binding domain